ncbi:GNAT family N-acetyltransferase [Anaerofilum sp. BX8]|uniref:GNAT family N-acetyltransferase n=1 Tax=Anaerofilum hominis TaxID=2763016 RepID=A0A923I6M8_9FIRM|nr:GNAT family N-acetyltransferase [Anaerofilum hominis]MBC5580804.1 GNAT family N-acetyltransferase [Anaerofilum hominis]
MTNGLKIREAEPKDVGQVLEFIRALAQYEKMEDQVAATEDGLREAMFGRGCAQALIAEEDGVPVGFALYFYNFSTFLGHEGLYLEDLFVLPQHRGKGYGKALFRALAQVAQKRGCGRFEWSCLNWNTPSIGFYRSLGAVPMDEWTVYRLTAPEIAALAES